MGGGGRKGGSGRKGVSKTDGSVGEAKKRRDEMRMHVMKDRKSVGTTHFA